MTYIIKVLHQFGMFPQDKMYSFLIFIKNSLQQYTSPTSEIKQRQLLIKEIPHDRQLLISDNSLKQYQILPDITGYYWVLPDITRYFRYYRILPGITGYKGFKVKFYDSVLILQTCYYRPRDDVIERIHDISLLIWFLRPTKVILNLD